MESFSLLLVLLCWSVGVVVLECWSVRVVVLECWSVGVVKSKISSHPPPHCRPDCLIETQRLILSLIQTLNLITFIFSLDCKTQEKLSTLLQLKCHSRRLVSRAILLRSLTLDL